jgi:type III secretion system YscI/HrpB-like protein
MMTEGLSIQQIVQKIAEQAAEKQEVAKPDAAAADDVTRFENALGGQSSGPSPPGADAPADISGSAKVEGSQGLGDAILNGMERAKSSHTGRVNSINKLLEKTGAEPMSVQDTMRLQFELMQLNIEQEITPKTADKSSQGVQTLFKNQ